MRALGRALSVLLALCRVLLVSLIPSRGYRARLARSLRRQLENLGGAWIKLGQFLALRFDLIPEDICWELTHLFDNAAPMPYEQVQALIVRELGSTPEDVFAEFDRTPIASASFGQVHLARVREGLTVAVKIQRAGMDTIVECDLALMRRIASAASRLQLFGATKATDLVDQIRRWMRSELDYLLEAENTVRLSRNDDSARDGHYATILSDYTTTRILTATYIPGPTLMELMRRDLSVDDDRYDMSVLCARLGWNALNQIYVDGLFHADLHPANIIATGPETLAYVDCGIVGQLTEDQRLRVCRYVSSLFGGDSITAANVLLQWVTNPHDVDTDAIRRELSQTLSAFREQLAARRDDQAPPAVALQVAVLRLIRKHNLALEPGLALYFKAILTLDMTIYALVPQFDLITCVNRFFFELAWRGSLLRALAIPTALAQAVYDAMTAGLSDDTSAA